MSVEHCHNGTHRVFPYTDGKGYAPSVIFPNHGMQILSIILNLIGMSIVTWALSRRTSPYTFYKLLRPATWKGYSWPRLCVVMVFMNSWAFIFTSGVLVSGAGLSLNTATCSLAIYACIILYASSKILVYAFLIEKVWIVWSQRGSSSPPTGFKNRWKNPVWRICILLLVPYLVILLLMLYGRIASLRTSDKVCVIGLKKIASLPLLSFDLFITFFLTALFVYPLRQTSLISLKLRKVATRTLVSSFAALVTSSVNIAILTVLNGQELGWLCLTSCGSDVSINAIVLFWVTTGTSVASRSAPHEADGELHSVGHDLEHKSPRQASLVGGARRKGRGFGGGVPRLEDQDFSDDDTTESEKAVVDSASNGRSCPTDSNTYSNHPPTIDYLAGGPAAFQIDPRTRRRSATASSGNGPPPCPVYPLMPQSAHMRPQSQRTVTTRSHPGRPSSGGSRDHGRVSSRADSAKSHSLKDSGVIVIRPRSSGAQSLGHRAPEPTMASSSKRSSTGGVSASAKTFLKGLGSVLGVSGNTREGPDRVEEMEVQVTVTTELNRPLEEFDGYTRSPRCGENMRDPGTFRDSLGRSSLVDTIDEDGEVTPKM